MANCLFEWLSNLDPENGMSHTYLSTLLFSGRKICHEIDLIFFRKLANSMRLVEWIVKWEPRLVPYFAICGFL